MSISVNAVTKKYGNQFALNNVNIEIKPGEIVGFLGPNGAGKSTMMKILTGYIPQTSGKAFVCGFDVEEDPIAVKKRIGYLPEHNPQYTEMYVKEYLSFCAGLFHVKNKKARIAEMIQLVGLQKEQHKIIDSLSKGYRQRVGLAQALLHNPEVLILDEPTTGLDPNQVVEIRNLIKDTGKEKTVMMSTHIMQEVEAVCDRVIIINRGEIVADKPIAELRKLSKSSEVIEVQFSAPPDIEKMKQIKGVNRITTVNDTVYRVETDADIKISPKLVQFAIDHDLEINKLQTEEQNIEDVFRKLTS